MPRYLLSVFGPTERTAYGNYGSKEKMLQAFSDTATFNDLLQRGGHLVFADGLEPAADAVTVDGRGEEPARTSSPYLPTAEQLSGFWVIDAADMDEALDLATKGSRACRGVVEVRPFHTEESIRELLEE